MEKTTIRKIAAVGDVLAIPGFIMLVIYFANLKTYTAFEIVLLIFSACGLLADLSFTILEFAAI